jgi:hypothetical protein
MRRAFHIHLALVVTVVIAYGCAEISWTSVKLVGLHAFPGSPDWGHTYMSAYDLYCWMRGTLFGLLVAGLPLALLARVAPDMGGWRTVVPIVAIAIPALALMLGHAHETRTVQEDARSGDLRFNLPVERSAYGVRSPSR